MITIQNDLFSAGVRLKGAELCSLIEKSSGREIIWQADPTIWGGSAPILFPIVGKLKDAKTRIDGIDYNIPKHGLLRTRTATVIDQSPEHAVLRFESDAETLICFPFPFTFEVSFRLSGNALAVEYTITNCGSENMLFTAGSHPAFALDLAAWPLSSCSVEFSEAESLDLYGLVDGLLALREKDYLKNESSIQLSESLFDQDALIFQHIKSRTLRLKPAGIEVDIRNNPHLGIWSKPGAPYVCIEPWLSFDDAADSDGVFKNKPGILSLPANETFVTGYGISIPR